MRMTGLTCHVVVVLLVSAAAAQTGGSDIQGRVKEGQKVTITDDQGREFSGRIAGITAKALTMSSHGAPVDVPYGEIVRIDRPNDTLANGALIGLTVGAALGIAAVVSEENANCEAGFGFYCSSPSAAEYVAATAIMGGLGAALGVGIDALIHRERNICRRGGGPRIALAPALARGVRGATFSVSW